ncbi:hypothetical protein PK35_15830 [Tamlana nanhaiensis]|uniref:Lipoprotein n=1 Tax=Neotamlana nanhaiensis TaxID=1382798 RepID=A0A0D7VWZ4_9FLAO|nr:hypothetical protein [Tamlana nanhaiensis]KJD31299.1 hypothetical protein PK35_15830 [Tamlana nanhaiensis]
MKFKGFVILSVIVVFFSCKKEAAITKDSEQEKKVSTQLVSEQEVAKLKYIEYALDAKTKEAIKDWKPYFELQDVINKVKLGDLGYFVAEENEVDLLLKNLEKTIPKAVNSASITARMLVLKTTMLKLKSLANLDNTKTDDLLLAIKENFTAFSNVNFQMNKKIEFDSRDIERP